MKPLFAALLALTAFPAAAAPAGDYRARLASDEIIYFVLPDRFEMARRRTIAAG